jgi:hypothetical protein
MNIRVEDGIGRDRIWPFQNPSNNSHLKRLETTFRASFGLSGRLADRRASLDASRQFTPQGLDTEVKKFITQEVFPGIVQGHVALRRARSLVADKMKQFRPAPPDKTDIVGAFRRSELREAIRALPKEQREHLLQRYSENLDREVATALLEHIELPWTQEESRLISDQTRAKLLRSVMATEHGAELAAVEMIQEAIKYSEPTILKAGVEIQTSLAMNAPQFEQALQDEAQKTPPLWLRRDGDAIRVLLVEKRTPHTIPTRPASQEEIESGTYFADLAAYEAAMAAAA